MNPVSAGGVRDARTARAVSETLRTRDPLEILDWALEAFGDRFCLTTSLADALLIDMVSRVRTGVDVLFVDTGYHFPETLRMRQQVLDRYPVHLITVAEQDAEHGAALFQRLPDLCCNLRKVEPLQAALSGYDAWCSGIRRDEAGTRSEVRVVEWDQARAMVKVNPLARWSQSQVDDYVREHDVLVNPLVAEGYLSIGCAPCTRPVLPGENARAGRWAGSAKTECGLHLVPAETRTEPR